LAAGEPAVVLDSGQPAELVLGDGVTAMTDLRRAVWGDDARLADAETAVQPPGLLSYRTSFRIEKYGAVDVTGATDSGAAVRATIAAAYAAGGGTIEFPTGVIRIDSLPMIPNNGAAQPVQPPMAFVGQGSHRDGGLDGSLATMAGGTILDIRDSSGIAKIDTRGRGVLTLRDLTLTNMGTADTIPFVKHTNTVLHVENVAIWGHSSKSGTACDQDGFQHGTAGTGYVVDGSATASYSGYGTTINGVYFNRIRRGIYGLRSCNALVASGLTFGFQCGADATAGAIHFDGTGDQARANQISDVIIESMGYVYPVYMVNANDNTFRGLQIWDHDATMVTAVYQGTNSGGNFYEGYIPAPPLRISGLSSAAFRTGKSTDATLGGATTLVQPEVASASEGVTLFRINRSVLESVNPNGAIFSVLQNGTVNTRGAAPVISVTNESASNSALSIDYQSLVRSSGNLSLYAGSSASNKVVIARGCLVITYGTTAQRPTPSGQPGCHYFDTTLGKPIWTDGSGVWVDATGTAV